MPPTMNHHGPVNHPISGYPYFQSQQTSHSGEHIPTRSPSYVYTAPSTSRSPSYVYTAPSTSRSPSHVFTDPSTLYGQDHVVNYNHEQTTAGMDIDSDQLTIPLELRILQQTIFEILPRMRRLKEIELTLPALPLDRHSMDMVHMQHAFINGLNTFTNLKRLTIPMEFVTTLLLSYLAILPNLQSLTVKYYPPPRPPHDHHHHQQFPAWSTDTIPAECPGYVFLAHMKFDPRGYFRKLESLNLRAPAGLSDVSYTALRKLFPKTYICWNEGTTLRN